MVALILRKVCDRPGRVDECDVTNLELHDLIVLNYSGAPGDLKYRVVVILGIDTSVLVSALEAVRTATKFHGSQSVNASSVHFARKGPGFDYVWRVPPADRPNRALPLLIIHDWRTEKIVARMRRCLDQ
jgi:hypothetical protein